MTLNPLQKLEDILKKSSYWGKDDYSTFDLYNKDENDTTRFSSSTKLHAVIQDLIDKEVLRNDEFKDIQMKLCQIDPCKQEYKDIINFTHNKLSLTN